MDDQVKRQTHSYHKWQPTELDVKWSRWERGVFGTLHVMWRRSTTRRWTAYALLFTEFIQMLTFVLSPDASFPWKSSDTLSNVLSVTSYINGSFLPAGSSMLAYYVGSVLWVVASLVLFGVVAHQVVHNNFASFLPLRILRIATFLASTVLYIPLLRGLLTVLKCSGESWMYLGSDCHGPLHISAMVATGLLGLALGVLALFVTSVYYDSTPFTPNLMARSNGRLQGIMIILKTLLTLMVSLHHVLPLMFRVVLVLVAGVVWHGSCLYFMPYLHPRMNSLIAAFSAAYLWAALCLATTASLDLVNATVGALFMGLGMPLGIVGGVAAGALRFISFRSPRRLRTPTALDLRVRWLLNRATVKTGEMAPPEECEGESQLVPHLRDDDGKHKPTSRQLMILDDDPPSETEDTESHKINVTDTSLWLDCINKAEREIVSGLKSFPKSAHMHSLAASFYRFIKPNWHLEKIEMAAAVACASFTSMDIRFRIFRRHLELVEKDTNTEVSALNSDFDLSVVSRVKLQQNVNKADQAALAAVSGLVRFWQELSVATPDLNTLHRLSGNVSEALASADTSYKAAIALAPDSSVLLRKYAMFLKHAMNDYKAGNELQEKARKKAKDAAKLFAPPLQAFEFLKRCQPIEVSGNFDEVAVVRSSLEVSEATTVIDANSNFFRLSGYTKSEIIGQSVDILIPEPLGTLHHRFVSRFLVSGHTRILNTSRRTVIRTREGLLQPIVQSVRVDNSRQSVSALMQTLKTEDAIVMFTWPDGLVRGVCARSRSLLRMDIEQMDREQASILTYFPRLESEIYRAVHGSQQKGSSPVVGHAAQSSANLLPDGSSEGHEEIAVVTGSFRSEGPERSPLPAWPGLSRFIVTEVQIPVTDSGEDVSSNDEDPSSADGNGTRRVQDSSDEGEYVARVSIQARFQQATIRSFSQSVVFLTWRHTAKTPLHARGPCPRAQRDSVAEVTDTCEPSTSTAGAGKFGREPLSHSVSHHRYAPLPHSLFLPDDEPTKVQYMTGNEVKYTPQAPARCGFSASASDSELELENGNSQVVTHSEMPAFVSPIRRYSASPHELYVHGVLPRLINVLTSGEHVNPVVKPLLRLNVWTYIITLVTVVGAAGLILSINSFSGDHVTVYANLHEVVYTLEFTLVFGLLPLGHISQPHAEVYGANTSVLHSPEWLQSMTSSVDRLGLLLQTKQQEIGNSVMSDRLITMKTGPFSESNSPTTVSESEATGIVHDYMLLYLYDMERLQGSGAAETYTETYIAWLQTIYMPDGAGFIQALRGELEEGYSGANVYKLLMDGAVVCWSAFIGIWTIVVALGAMRVVKKKSRLLHYFLLLPEQVVHRLFSRAAAAKSRMEGDRSDESTVASGLEAPVVEAEAVTAGQGPPGDTMGSVRAFTFPTDLDVTAPPAEQRSKRDLVADRRKMKHPKLFHFRLWASLFVPLAVIMSAHLVVILLSRHYIDTLRSSVEYKEQFEQLRLELTRLVPSYVDAHVACDQVYRGHSKPTYNFTATSSEVFDRMASVRATFDAMAGAALTLDSALHIDAIDKLWSQSYCDEITNYHGFNYWPYNASALTEACEAYNNGVLTRGLAVGLLSYLREVTTLMSSVNEAQCRAGGIRGRGLVKTLHVHYSWLVPGLHYTSESLDAAASDFRSDASTVAGVWSAVFFCALLFTAKRVYNPQVKRTNAKISRTITMLLLIPAPVIHSTPRILAFVRELATSTAKEETKRSRKQTKGY